MNARLIAEQSAVEVARLVLRTLYGDQSFSRKRLDLLVSICRRAQKPDS